MNARAPTFLCAIGLATVIAVGPAFAQQAPGKPDAAEPGQSQADPNPEQEVAPDWDSAPLPTEASGVVQREPAGASALLWIPRVAFFVPKWAIVIAAQPIRGAAWVYERYQVRDRLQQVFFNDEGTFGIYPLAFFETGFGLNAGVRMIHRDLFGKGERARFRASYGGRFRQIYSTKLGSGERFGDRVEAELEGSFEIRPKDRFFGVGNHDLVAAAAVATPVDAIRDDVALSTRFEQQVVRLLMGMDLRLAGGEGGELSGKISGALMYRDFAGGENRDNYTGTLFEPDSLVGLERGLANLYGEAELRYDSRRRTWEYWSAAMPSTGWMLAGFAGYAKGVEDDPSAYVRYGADLQRYICIYNGSRVLALRLYAEGVSSPVDELPFVDLPSLGGPRFLRGYQLDRFRDRIATVGSAEYLWDLGTRFAGVLFVDAGRVWRRWKDLELEGIRVGYGMGMQMHTRSSFLMRLDVSSSIDGGFFFNLGFDPVYDVRDRAGRY